MQAPPEIARMEHDMPFQRRVWRAERIGWAAMAALVVAALAGLSGAGGPLAEGSAEAGGVRVDWPRIHRLGRAAPIRIALPAEPGAAEAEIRLDPALVSSWRLDRVVPEPRESRAGPEGLVLRLGRDDAGGAAVMLLAEPEGAPGPRRLRLSAAGRELDLPVFVWP